MPMFTSRRPKATFGCRRKSLLRRRRMRNRSSRVRKPSQRRTSRPVSGTRLVAPSQSSTACKSSRCLVIPRDIPAMNFRQRDKASCFGATSSMHSASSCSIPRSPRFSTSTRPRLRRRGNNCCLRAGARLTSQIGRNGVVPFRKDFAGLDAQRGDRLSVWLETGWILFSVQVGGHSEAGFGCCIANQVEHLLIADQGLGSPVLGDLGEQTMLDGIPFGGPGLVV